MAVITVRPGEIITVIGLAADPNAPAPSHPIMLPGMPGWGSGGPVDPGYSPPWAQVRPPVDPGYSPPWAQVPGAGAPYPDNTLPVPPPVPVDPGHPWVPPSGPVDPGYSPPWATIPDAPDGGGHWIWAWSPQAGRWMWVRVPGQGEAGPKGAPKK